MSASCAVNYQSASARLYDSREMITTSSWDVEFELVQFMGVHVFEALWKLFSHDTLTTSPPLSKTEHGIKISVFKSRIVGQMI